MGDLEYPLLADFHPHGEMTSDYGLFNGDIGTPRRAIIIVDKGGTVRFRQEYVPGTLPTPEEILGELDKLGS